MLEYCADVYPDSTGYAPPVDPMMRSFPFRCIGSGMHRTKPSYYTRRDQFCSYLLIVTVGGCGRMHWKDKSCLLPQGSAVLIDTRIYQEYAPVSGEKWDFYYLHFDALSIEGYRDTLLSVLTPITLRSPDTVYQYMEHLHRLSHETGILSYAAQSNAISALLTELLYSLSEDHTASEALSRADIGALADYIEAHCTEELQLDQLSEYIKLSKHHLIRIFRRQIGMSPMKYLHKCRVSRAQQLLCTEALSVRQIAAAVGYRDPIVFTRHFRDFHGMTPTAYRKSNIRVKS